MREITEQQKVFADHYFETGNQNKAVELAGYKFGSDKDRAGKASRLKKSPAVKRYLEERSKALIESSSKEVAQYVKALDKRNIAELEVWKAYQAIDDKKHATKYKYLELFLKLKGHLSEKSGNSYLFYQDNRQLNHTEIVESASKIMKKMQLLNPAGNVYTPNVSEPIETAEFTTSDNEPPQRHDPNQTQSDQDAV